MLLQVAFTLGCLFTLQIRLVSLRSLQQEFVKREAQGGWEIGEKENDIVIINSIGNWDLAWSCCNFAPRRKACL